MYTLMAISVLVVVFDQLSKTVVASNMVVGDSIVIIDHILSFTYVKNEGAAWGILANHRWVFLVFLSLILILFCPILLKNYLLMRPQNLFAIMIPVKELYFALRMVLNPLKQYLMSFF